MNIFLASRLSNGNLLFPTEIHIDDHYVTIVKPGIISGREKSLELKDITSVEVMSPVFGFSKVIITAHYLDTILAEGFERRDAEIIKQIILKNKKGK